jgi:glucose-1-phosphate thymidylyltransferase
MKAIIPAAGIGTRLRPHTYSDPKALLFVAGKPILSHILDEVLRLRPSQVIVIVGYLGDRIRRFLEDRYPDSPIQCVEQTERLGIGHAVYQTRELAEGDEPLLMILGDTIVKADLDRFVQAEANALGVKEVEDPRRFGVCEVRDGRIARLVEKPEVPPSKLALVGLYFIRDTRLLFQCLREQQERDIRTRGEYQITDALQMMIERGAVFRPHEIDAWYDCGKPEAMLETNRALLEGVGAPESDGRTLFVPPVIVEEGARVEASVIGPYVSIARGAVVERSVLRDTIVGEEAHLKHCLLEGSLIGPRARVFGNPARLNVGEDSVVEDD